MEWMEWIIHFIQYAVKMRDYINLSLMHTVNEQQFFKQSPTLMVFGALPNAFIVIKM